MTEIKSTFDLLSADYDSRFTQTNLGEYYRERVQSHMQQYWPGDKNILEINAGTGEDAIFLASLGNHVLATDKSSQMLRIIRDKVKKGHQKDAVKTRLLPIEDLQQLYGHSFDGLLSNFGGLNCVENIQVFSQNIKDIIKPGGVIILCIMGPYVPWEWVWFSIRGQFKKAFRRVSGQAQWRNTPIYYPSVLAMKKTMKQASFTCINQEALGFLMPPSYVEHKVRKRPKLFNILANIEQLLCRYSLTVNLADHYVLVFERDEKEVAYG